MHGAGFGMQRLHLRQQPHRANNVVGFKRKLGLTNLVDRAHRFLDGFDAAQSAANRAGQAPASRLEARIGLVFQPDLDVDPGAMVLDLDRLDFVGQGDDAFSQREAQREILEISRARHHHRMGGASKGERHRRLLRHHSVGRGRAAGAVRQPRGLRRRFAARGQDYSAACSRAMRRLCSACSL